MDRTRLLFTALDNLIAQKRVPAMIAISISNGGGDAQGSERGLEYDTMSGHYAEFVETEVLPLVEKQYNVKLTKDPEGRATMGGSSGGSCALIMAWYHPELYHRVLTYSGTYVNQQWPVNPETPHGAWEFHETSFPTARSSRYGSGWRSATGTISTPCATTMHDWVLANENMAKVLAAKGYHYQFVFARNAGHTDRAVKQQTLPQALEYVWQGYPIAGEELICARAGGVTRFRDRASRRSAGRSGCRRTCRLSRKAIACGPFSTAASVVARGVADRRVKEAGADIAVGFDHGRYPRRIAARRDVGLQSVVRAEVRDDAAQLLGRLQNEAVGGIRGDQRFHLAFQLGQVRRHVGLRLADHSSGAIERGRTQVRRQERDGAQTDARARPARWRASARRCGPARCSAR